MEAGAANHAGSWEGGKAHACGSAPGGCLALSPRDGTWWGRSHWARRGVVARGDGLAGRATGRW